MKLTFHSIGAFLFLPLGVTVPKKRCLLNHSKNPFRKASSHVMMIQWSSTFVPT